jgi:hypothetical protein
LAIVSPPLHTKVVQETHVTAGECLGANWIEPGTQSSAPTSAWRWQRQSLFGRCGAIASLKEWSHEQCRAHMCSNCHATSCAPNSVLTAMATLASAWGSIAVLIERIERNMASETSLLQIGSFSQHGLTCELYPVPFPDMVACGGDCGGVVAGCKCDRRIDVAMCEA